MDLDIYVQDITLDKLVKIEKALIKSVSSDYKLVVIRKPIVMTWILWKNADHYFKIQCNLLNIKNWKEVFITYHSDFLCIGFDIQQSNFVYLKERWDYFLSNSIQSYMANNLFNKDNQKNLNHVSLKYSGRNLYLYPVPVQYKIKIDKDAITVEDDDNGLGANNIEDDENGLGMSNGDEDDIYLESGSVPGSGSCSGSGLSELCSIMPHIKNSIFLISNTVNDIYINYKTPSIMHLYKLNIKDLNLISEDLCFKKGYLCPILLIKRKIMVKHTNCSMSHCISLEAYIKLKSNKCPICRATINIPEIVIY